MTFQPVIPLSGNAGWAFLSRTASTQEAAFQRGPALQRDTSYFVENIGSIQSAEELVADRRLLTVALGAFGLDDDLPNKAFVEKVLSEGTLSRDAFANKLADKRYAAMSEAFGFDLEPPNTAISSFPDAIVSSYQTRQFEKAVGEQDPSMRLALAFERELRTISERDISEDGLWFTIMGTPPLRTVFEGALNLPSSLGSLDVDRQLEILKSKSVQVFGDPTVRQFNDPQKQEDLIRRFLVGSEVSTLSSNSVRGSVALSILQNLQPQL